jgi:hypothetical protein
LTLKKSSRSLFEREQLNLKIDPYGGNHGIKSQIGILQLVLDMSGKFNLKYESAFELNQRTAGC